MKKIFFKLSCITFLFFVTITYVYSANSQISRNTAQSLLTRAFETTNLTGIKHYSHLTDTILDQTSWAIGCNTSCLVHKENNPEIFKGSKDFTYAFDTACLRAEVAKRFGRLPKLKNMQKEHLRIKNKGNYILTNMCGDAGADSIQVHFASMRLQGNLTLIKGILIDSVDEKSYGTLTIGVIPDKNSPFGYIFESIDLK